MFLIPISCLKHILYIFRFSKLSLAAFFFILHCTQVPQMNKKVAINMSPLLILQNLRISLVDLICCWENLTKIEKG